MPEKVNLQIYKGFVPEITGVDKSMPDDFAKKFETDKTVSNSIFANSLVFENNFPVNNCSIVIDKNKVNTIDKNKNNTINPKLTEYGIDLDKPFEITKDMIEKMRSKGKKGFFESIKDGVKNAIPFVSGALEIKKSIELLAIAKKQERGEKLTKEETEKLYLYLLKQIENEHRGSTFMGKVGEMISHLPAFAGEFAATGGLYSAGNKAALIATRKILGHVVKKQIGKTFVKKASAVAVGSAFRTVALTNTYAGIVQRRTELDTSGLKEKTLEDGTKIQVGKLNIKKADESAGTSIAKGFLDGYIESLSEQSGQALIKPMSKIPLIGKFLAPPKSAQKFLNKIGYNGLFEEYAEERFGGFLRGAIALDKPQDKSYIENLYDSTVPTWEQTGVELTTTALWGGGMHAVHSTGSMIVENIKEKEIEKFKQELMKNTDFTTSDREFILHCTTKDNIELARELCDKNDFYDGFQIAYILRYTTKDNIEIARELCNKNDFPKDEIGDILEYTTKDNIDFVRKILKCENLDEIDICTIFEDLNCYKCDRRPCRDEDFSKEEIESILKSTSNNYMEFARELCNDRDFAKDEIINILNKLNDYNIELAKEVCRIKYFPIEIIASVLKHTTKDNIELARELCQNKYPIKFNRIAFILEYTTKDNIELARELCQNIYFVKSDIAFVLEYTTKDNIELARELCNKKDFPKNEIAHILKHTTKDNIEFARELCNKKDFPKGEISYILIYTTKYNIELIRELWQNKYPIDEIVCILEYTYEYNIELARELCRDKKFPIEDIVEILDNTNADNIELARELYDKAKQGEIAHNLIPLILNKENHISYKNYKLLVKKLGKEFVNKLSKNDLKVACQLIRLYKVNNINEIRISDKKEILRKLVESNTGVFDISDELRQYFPLAPKNQEEYCALLPQIVKSLGIETRVLKPEEKISDFNNSMSNLGQTLSALSTQEFVDLEITQEFSKEKFIETVIAKTKDLSEQERQKVYDYFGFELHYHYNKKTKTKYPIIVGYPVNLNNGKKLAQIENPETKAVVESLRPDVIAFSTQKVKVNNPQVEKLLNEILTILPEMQGMINKEQHDTHDFDVMKHSLKVMQKISQDENFKKLNESDKKIMLLASLLHDITKVEGSPDPTHATEGSFDTFFIAKKFSLTKEEEIKLYKLIRHHEWLGYVNSSKSQEKLTKRLQSVAFDLQQDNLFDMALIFTHADLRAVKTDDSFHDEPRRDRKTKEIIPNADGSLTGYGIVAETYAKRIKELISELKTTQPLLPVTKLPNAETIRAKVTQINPDGTTNIKGLYIDKDGLVIIKFNEVENWEELGFPKGTISRGITTQVKTNKNAQPTDVDTGNLKFFVHGLEYSNQLAKFDAFSLVDSDVLLSVSYAERPESKYRFFRTQGVLLDVDTKYIYGGGNTDSGSGLGKFIQEFKDNYIFGGRRESDRTYIADMIKAATGMNTEEYTKFVEENKNKSLLEIEPADIREKIIKAFAGINSNVRKGERAYNEMYVSNPNVMGVFAYAPIGSTIDNPVEYLPQHNKSLGFLKQYALEKDLPFILLGE